jgi:hypothetical protein
VTDQPRSWHGHLNADGSAKAVFLSKRTARQAVARRRPLYGSKLSVYACRECPGWHIGHAPLRGSPG